MALWILKACFRISLQMRNKYSLSLLFSGAFHQKEQQEKEATLPGQKAAKAQQWGWGGCRVVSSEWTGGGEEGQETHFLVLDLNDYNVNIDIRKYHILWQKVNRTGTIIVFLLTYASMNCVHRGTQMRNERKCCKNPSDGSDFIYFLSYECHPQLNHTEYSS